MRPLHRATGALRTVVGIGVLLVPRTADLQAQPGRATQAQQPQTALDLQRTYDDARGRREPVTQLLADGFVEIQADGRVLTRSQAIEKYTRFDDISAGSLSERRTTSHGDVAIIAGRTGEEGSSYSARRLYVWVNERGFWRLLVFQKTFMRPRTVKLSSLFTEWPAEDRNDQPPLTEEQTFATRNPALLAPLLADDSILVDGYGEQLAGHAWLAQLNDTRETSVNVRSLRLLSQGDAVIVIGEEFAAQTYLTTRFTRVWTQSSQGRQLRVSQMTFAAAGVSGSAR